MLIVNEVIGEVHENEAMSTQSNANRLKINRAITQPRPPAGLTLMMCKHENPSIVIMDLR